MVETVNTFKIGGLSCRGILYTFVINLLCKSHSPSCANNQPNGTSKEFQRWAKLLWRKCLSGEFFFYYVSNLRCVLLFPCWILQAGNTSLWTTFAKSDQHQPLIQWTNIGILYKCNGVLLPNSWCPLGLQSISCKISGESHLLLFNERHHFINSSKFSYSYHTTCSSSSFFRIYIGIFGLIKSFRLQIHFFHGTKKHCFICKGHCQKKNCPFQRKSIELKTT